MLKDDQLSGSELGLSLDTLRAQMRVTVVGMHLGKADYLTAITRWAVIGLDCRLLSTIALD